MDLTRYTDREIVAAIMRRDTVVTKEYLYRKCRPLFESCFNRFYTDCESPIELINEIYLYIMLPSSKTGRSKISTFKYKCTFTCWLKTIAENYCKQLFKQRKSSPLNKNNHVPFDRKVVGDESLGIDLHSLNMADLNKLFARMNNEDYVSLIKLHYLDGLDNKKTADLLSVTMANYYNMHLRAKEQFKTELRKEGLI